MPMQPSKPQGVALRPHLGYPVMVVDGLCISAAALVLPLLQEHAGIGYAGSGTLLAVMSAGNLTAAFLAGTLPRLIGMRRTALLLTGGLALGYGPMGLSALPSAILPSFLLVGFGKGSIIHHATVAVNSVAQDHTRATNLQNALFATGALLAPFAMRLFGILPRWQAPLWGLSLLGLFIWLLFLRMELRPEPLRGREAESLSFLRERHFWFCVAYLFCQQCSEITLSNWVVTYFKDAGILSGALSAYTVTIFWLAELIGRLIIVFCLPAGSRLRTLTFFAGSTLCAYVLLMRSPAGLPAFLSLGLIGLCISGAYPTVIAHSSRNLSNASVGVMIPVAGIGAILMPWLVGVVAQGAGIGAAMLCPMASLAAMLLFGILADRNG